MSIFVIAFLGIFIGSFVAIIAGGIMSNVLELDEGSWRFWMILLLVLVIVSIGVTFVGIGICQRDEYEFVAEYEAQKATIEQSLECEELTGFERFELVKQATELNRELAERKTKFNYWDHVYFDNTIYDGVEPIRFN